MIPTTNDILNTNLEVEIESSKSYKMHYEDEVINGIRDELSAMEQVVYKILNTERYEYLIYSHNYGVELLDLFGEPVLFVCSELERRITEALVQDDRIESVDSFSFNTSIKKTIHVTFVVSTIFGDVDVGKVVNY